MVLEEEARMKECVTSNITNSLRSYYISRSVEGISAQVEAPRREKSRLLITNSVPFCHEPNGIGGRGDEELVIQISRSQCPPTTYLEASGVVLEAWCHEQRYGGEEWVI